MKPRWRPFVLASVGVAGALAVVVAVFGPPHRWLVALGLADPSESEMSLVLAWAAAEPIAPGTDAALRLPAALGWASPYDTVQGFRGGDGRVCVLVKRSIGWKENFEGTLACTAAIGAGERFGGVAGGGAYVAIERSRAFRELYVSESVGPGMVRVYFDLN